MSTLDQITTIEIGVPGPSGAGISSSEKTAFDSRLTALEAGASLVVKDEGSTLTTNATALNFVGAGVTATGTGATKTITIPSAALTVQEGDVTVASSITTLDFDSHDFNLTESPTGEINISSSRPRTYFIDQTKNSGFSSVTTTLGTVDSVEIGPLSNLIDYDIECEVVIRCSPDSGGYVEVGARIAGDSTSLGERALTVGVERSITATAHKIGVTGDAVTTYTLAARAQMSSGTGTVTSCHIRGRAIPR